MSMKLVKNYLSGGARLAVLLAVAITFFAGSGRAQEFRGTISGVVTDPTGAVVPGAAVVARETQTGTTSQTKSDNAGQYVVPFLLPGTYSITVTMPGFQKTEQKNITLQSQEHPIVNISLAIGNAAQTVTVTTAPPLLDQANASVGSVISTKSVEDLPLDGRTPAVLQELSVGVISTAAPQLIHPFDNNAANSWSIGGTPNQVSEVLLDGSPDLTILGAVAYNPSEDTVAEVSVRPFDTDASFGHTIGGVVNQITKSGTNRLHGTAYEFSQISDIDANTYFNDRNNKKLQVTHFNQYGGTIGGPIFLPKLYNGKDKLFFFFAFEGLKDSQPSTYTTTVPTSAERGGDFSQLLAGGCSGGSYTVNATTGLATCNSNSSADPNQIYDPFTATLNGSNVTRQPIANNQLLDAATASGGTVGSINAVAAAYLKLLPLPNATSGVGADGQDNYITNAPSNDTYNNEFGRVDYNINSRDHIFFDMRHNNRTQVKNNYFGNGITGTSLLRENFGATLDNVLTINPTTILDTRFNWTYFDEVHGTPASAYSPTSVGLPSSMNAASEFLQLPYVNFATGGSCGSVTSYQCLGATGSGIDPTTSYQAFVDVVKILGRHTLKIGFDGRQYRLRDTSYGNSSGNFTFNSSFVTAGTGAANQSFGGDLASFLFGLPGSGSFDINSKASYLNYYVGTFVQDDWRVTDRLTVNMGLRFDIDTPFGERNGATVNGFNPTAINSASAAASTAFGANTYPVVTSLNTLGGLTFPSGPGGAPYQTNSGFLSPRFGFSYSPAFLHDKTVIRGGFGFFVQPETVSSYGANGVTSSNAISNQEGFSATTAYVATTNNYLTNANTLSNPFPTGFTQPAGSSQGASTFLGESVSFLSPVEHDPYSERWDLGFQQSVTHSTLFEMLYVGNHALHLPIAQQNLNATSKQYLSTTPYRNQAMSMAYGASVANPFYGLLPNGGSANGKTVSLSSLLVPYPQFGTNNILDQNETVGQSYFNSLILHIEQREHHGLTLTANYSFSKLTEADTYLNDQDTTPTHRISPYDHTHHFTVGATYDLPFGRGKTFSFGGSRLMDELLGGFVVNGVYQFQTGAPIEFSADIPLQPGVTLRQISNQHRNTSPTGTGTPALSTSQFVTGNYTAKTCPTTGACDGSQFINGQYYDHYRTLPQTLSWVRSDGFNNLDASILKDFHFTSSAYLQLRFETFNTLNHPIFAAPNVSSATASNFGYITSTYANSLPRQVQLGARIVF
jgi:hypothetical protein